MPWFRVDDTLSSHPKARAAGLAAMGLWAVSGAYCAQYLTEGHVPEWYVSGWPQGKKLAALLVVAGLWMPTDDGWLFHQWEERQPTKEQVETDRKATRVRQQQWRDRKREKAVTNGVSNSVTNGVTNASPTLPNPPLEKEKHPSKAQTEVLFEAFWKVYPKKVGKLAAQRRYEVLIRRGVDPAQLLDGATKYRTSRHGQDPEFTKHAEGWLTAGRWLDDDGTADAKPAGWEFG